jgi:WD40 repeat protein
MSATAAPVTLRPYKGLAPFGDSDLDAMLFFGREREREIVSANLIASRLTVLYGASGVGKSSMLRAGVAHGLRELARTEPGHAVVVYSSWAEDPVAGLTGAIATETGVEAGDEPLTDTVAAASAVVGGELYLVLDQFEEFFLYHDGDDRPNTLGAQLPELLRRRGLHAHVLISVREDALAQLDAFKPRIPTLFGNVVRLDHLDRSSARAAIVLPIERYNELAPPDERMRIETDLVEAVLVQVAAGRVALGDAAPAEPAVNGHAIEAPYLQLVMERLWDEERAAGSPMLRLETLRRLGGAEAIVRDHLERALAELDPREEQLAAEALKYLVTPSRTKIAHGSADLAGYAAVSVAALAPVLSKLTDQRVLRALAPVDGSGRRFEIFHDVLAEPVLAWRRRFETKAALARERRASERRHRRLLLLAVGALLLAAAMTAVTVYAITQRSEANTQRREAQEQAQIAKAQRNSAVVQRKRADDNYVTAVIQRRKAEQNARRARAFALKARKNAKAAEAAQADAEQQKNDAVAAQQEADQNAAAAQASQKQAQQEAAAADKAQQQQQHEEALAKQRARQAQREKRIAVAQRKRAARNERRAVAGEARARIGELTSNALALLSVDPERSLRASVQAARLAAASPQVEAALRRSLLATIPQVKLQGGGGPVRAASFSPDGRFVATAADAGVRIFRRSDSKLLFSFPAHRGAWSLAFSSDGRLLAAGSYDGTAIIRSTQSGNALHSLPVGGSVTSIAFADGDRLLVTGSTDGNVRVWDVGSGDLLQTFDHGVPIRGIDVSPDGKLVLTFTVDRFARVYDLESGALVKKLEQQGEVTDGHFSQVGDMIVTTGRRNAYIWDTRTWALRYLLGGTPAAIGAAAFSPDGKTLATVSLEGQGRLWDLTDGTLENTLPGHTNTPVAVAFSRDGALIATGSKDKTARLYTRARLGGTSIVLAGHTGAVSSVSFSPDGTTVLTASTDGTARLWKTAVEEHLEQIGKHDGPVTTVTPTPDGRLVVSAAADGTAHVWKADGGSVRGLKHGGKFVRATVDRTGSRVLTWGDDGFARLWNLGTGRVVATFEHGAPIAAAAVSHDGRLVLTAGDDGNARIWTAGGKLLHTLPHGDEVNAAKFSPDDSVVATGGGDNLARLWDVSSGRLLATLRGHTKPITALAFNPAGTRLATASTDDTGRIWDVPSGRFRATLEGHSDALRSIVFSPNGKLVLTASVDAEARTWNAETGDLVNSFARHVAVVADAEFSPDGRWIVTAGPTALGLWGVDGAFLFFLRLDNKQLTTASFTSDGQRIVTGSVDGRVAVYNCSICGRTAQLLPVAEKRLADLDRRDANAGG